MADATITYRDSRPIESVTLTLTAEEAAVLKAVLGKCIHGPCYKGQPRVCTTAIWEALHAVPNADIQIVDGADPGTIYISKG